MQRLFFLLAVMPLAAFAEKIPFDDPRWQVSANETERVKLHGEDALWLKGGAAMLDGVSVRDSIIEYDIAIDEQRGFAGARFRSVGPSDFEHFYVRPHQSGNPDANQYTPVFNGVTGWQLYHGAGYANPVEYRFNEWMHVKIAFRDSQAEVFIDSDEPVLVIPKLKRDPATGGVGLDAANFAGAWFANFEVSDLPDDYRFASANQEDRLAAEPGTVMSWLVSETFDPDLLGPQLAESFINERSWQMLRAEANGITNLARVQGIAQGSNAAIARITVESDSAQVKDLRFGYSDDVSVYLNGEAIYSGSNFYQSRDYRYLGTIGLYDSVHLPLVEGENEIWFAVTEAFGGWGVIAAFDDLDGIEIL